MEEERDDGRLTASIHHRYCCLFVEAEGAAVLARRPRLIRPGNKGHLSPSAAAFICDGSSHVADFTFSETDDATPPPNDGNAVGFLLKVGVYSLNRKCFVGRKVQVKRS